jgi:translation elongation factor EF-Tu-like GTPase
MRAALVTLILAAIGVGSAMWFRRPKVNPPSTLPAASAAAFDMPIDDAFRLKVEGSVVVVGVIAAGEIKLGMRLEIRTGNGAIPVTVTALEGGPDKPISHARAGDRVGVMLQGVAKDQVPAGSRLSGSGG